MQTQIKNEFKKKKKKKRARSSDEWDSFIYELKTRSQPGKTKLLDIKYNFDLDQLPVKFGELTEDLNEDNASFHQLNQTIKLLNGLIREAGGHRFRIVKTTRKEKSKYYFYNRSQDSSRIQNSKKTGKRDRWLMTRFPCESRLVIKPDLNNHDSEDAVTPTSAYLDILKEQKELGNKKLLKVFKANDTKNLQLLAEVRRRKGQRTMPRTRDQNNHPTAMYYR